MLSLVSTALISTAAAGPWIDAPGAHYVKASVSRFAATEYVDPNAQTTSTVEYVGYTTSLYGQVGLPGNLQVHASVPYVNSRNRDRYSGWIHRTAGPGDAWVGLGADVPRLELPAALTVQARIPLYNQAVLEPDFPAIGDTNLDVDAQLSIGHSLPVGDHWLWLASEAGFRWRTEVMPAGFDDDLDFVNGVPYRGQIGLAPGLGGWLSLEASGLVNAAPRDVTRSWHQLALGGAVPITHGVHIELGGQWIHTASASSKGWAATAGVSRKG
ncbi:MAG: hypothetical protein GY913_11555 [Proteobacteria bacterium]|nr:hypothetical protein [Pseudomonadota bacterium]